MTRRIESVHLLSDRALLVELESLAGVLAVQTELTINPAAGQVDVIAGAGTVVVTTRTTQALNSLVERLQHFDLDAHAAGAGLAPSDLISIDTVYDGPDLDGVGLLTGLTRDGVVAAHSSQVWTAAFGGFAPGFAYLVGENESLTVPRRDIPRVRVPEGSVALGNNYSAIYPRSSPGGWQLIGHTNADSWNLDRADPAMLRPGSRVRFHPVRAQAVAASSHSQPTKPRGDTRTSGLRVIAPGLQSTVQDLGRPGLAHLGVTASGALDRGALVRANRLVGNPPGAAGLEHALGGLTLEAASDQVLAVTGADAALRIRRSGDAAEREVASNVAFALLAGERLTIGSPRRGVRSYVALRGGIDGPLTLGSRSSDTLSGLGPTVLAAGTHLSVLAVTTGGIVGAPGLDGPNLPDAATVTDLRFTLGPRASLFSPETLARFGGQEWTVTTQSNRIGIRLSGEPLLRSQPGELASEGTLNGSIQVPPSGLPVLFLADHPVTGGYPVLGVVLDADIDRAAQLAAGSRIRFISVKPAPGGPADSRTTRNDQNQK
ncbi:carboxyltransferase domain-containing protein [Cryobacterium sp. Hh7]|uniref:5-oxoprolinase subunit B/C family protein n=1 Tax=Cryobacterium sp. Hh7 TaxID=1259159 RepID=UPI00106A04BC|nr:carboxyltransferase domain-containing protein [Cryobacterium sp. Hh7]TFD49880.1 carboxyltransferase domain-containing protein [Cryobacterium sp. Hh7]